MSMSKLTKWVLLSIALSVSVVTFTACGSSNTKTIIVEPTEQEKAIIKIATYADDGLVAPTVEDYQDAGVVGVRESNLDEVNAAIEELDAEDVDTTEKIQDVVDEVNDNLPEPTPTPEPSPEPSPSPSPSPTPTPTVPSPFVMTVQINNDGGQFTIPTTGAGYNYSIDCENDGILDAQQVTKEHTCNYAVAGQYKIAISGAFPRIYFNETAESKRVVNVFQWGTIAWKSMAHAFAGCVNMSVEADDVPNLAAVTDMSYMFKGAAMLQGTVSTAWNLWNVSSVKNMSNMFLGADDFNQNISTWNVANVTDMTSMFNSANVFNQDISGWNVANVTDMTEMFHGAKSFEQNLGDWKISKVTTMKDMFKGVKLDTANYDSILIGWAKLIGTPEDVQNDVDFHGGSSKYSANTADPDDAFDAHKKLKNNPTPSWQITDGGHL